MSHRHTITGECSSNGQNAGNTVAQSQPQCHVVHHEFGGPAELTTTLVHAISDVTGIDVTDSEFTLNDYVDSDALNRLFKPKPDGRLRYHGSYCFAVWDYQITVSSTGRITIAPPAGTPPVQG